MASSKGKRRLLALLFVLFACVFCASAGMLGWQLYQDKNLPMPSTRCVPSRNSSAPRPMQTQPPLLQRLLPATTACTARTPITPAGSPLAAPPSIIL